MESLFDKIKYLKSALLWINRSFGAPKKLKSIGANTIIEMPNRIESPESVTIEENVNIRFGLCIINTKSESVLIKRNTTIAPNVTIVTNNHVPTVGIPTFLLTSSHINDKSTDVIIEEDVWIGANATIMAGTKLGRGCIIGANAVVTKSVPPYAVAVGIPAKIIAVKFTMEQIIRHERILYAPNDRLSVETLRNIFLTFFENFQAIGVELVRPEDKIVLDTLKQKKKYIENRL